MPVSGMLSGNGVPSNKAMARLRGICVVLFVAVFLYYVVHTLRWPMIWDTPIMHYVRFLMTQGFKPYSQITDFNLPGCYITEGWGMAVFGWSDLSWRVYEFFLMAVLAVCGMVIGGRRNWIAGLVAATFFVVMHASEGPRVATERDELMAILLVAATAAMLLAMRRRAAWWMLPMGLCCALATSIKPAALLMELGLILLVVWQLRKTGAAVGRYVWWMLAGDAAIAAFVLDFLVRNRAIGPLWFIATKILPSYAKLVQPGAAYMLRHLLPAAIVPLTVIGVVAWLRRGEGFQLERWAIWLGVVVGAASYGMQGKGLTYHRYMVVIFVMLWVGWEISDAMHREDARSRWTAVTGLVVLFVVTVPYYVYLTRQDLKTAEQQAPLAFQLQRDLVQLGGDKLQHQVLCLDMINGCFDALYRLRLVQNTGATGDLLLFSMNRDFAVDYYRQWFMDRDSEHPADVVVLENEWYQNDEAASFNKLKAWPQYAEYLQRAYVPVLERRFGATEAAPAYRIYLRRGSDVLARVAASPLR